MPVKDQGQLLAEHDSAYPRRSIVRYGRESALIEDIIDTMFSGGILNDRIIVTTDNFAETLGGTIDSTKEYFLDGVVDTGGISIEIPSTGLTIKSYSFEIGGLTSSADNYKMFIGATAGTLISAEMFFTASGSNSQVFDLTSATGNEAFEFNRVNFIDCTSLGEVINYRQGLEFGSGRFGGTPTLTLTGVWLGGYRITTALVRGLDAGMTSPLFSAGSGFTMNSRFLTDINCDLPASAALADFSPSNFPNPSTVQANGAIITRNGVSDPTDTNIWPNLTEADLASNWNENVGMKNTFEGGNLEVDAQQATVINTLGVYETLDMGTPIASELVHFDTPSPGQLRHLGNNPRDYRYICELVVEGTANNQIACRLSKFDSSAGTTSPLPSTEQPRQINSLVGGRDVAFFSMYGSLELDQNDYVFLEIVNNSGTGNLTVENGSSFILEER